jgi:outer membrane receptor protein involved in Fe transport
VHRLDAKGRPARLGVCLNRLIALALAGALVCAPVAGAQTTPDPSTPAPAAQPPDDASKKATTVQPVTVTAKTSGDRRYIDRRSYSLARDVTAANGSLADALRNVPSVDVDPRGNLSVRGDTHVTILVDGQPSALFQGSNQADVLRQLPADQFERVEVITNPSAAYKPDGSGGIINLISKKSHVSKPTGTIKASIDPAGRYSASLNGNATWNKLTLSGGGGFRHDFFDVDAQTAGRLVDPASGETAQTTSTSHAREAYTTTDLHAAVDDDLDAKTRLSANIGYFAYDADQPLTSLYRSSATTGVLAQDFGSAGDIGSNGSGVFGNTSYRREFSGDDHNLMVNLSYSDFTTVNINRSTLSYSLPAQPDLFQDLDSTNITSSGELKAEYKAPMPGQGRLDAGYDLEFDSNTLEHKGLLGLDPGDATSQPGLSDRFRADQTINALFATYQQPVGRFDIQPGLRLEAARLDTDQLLIGAKTSQTYLDAYPTLHLGYKLDDKTQLTLSYTRRVQRPSLEQLDPFRVYYSPLSFSQGDVHLKPSITDSYEAGYEYTEKSNDYLVTLYYRDHHDVATSLSENLGGGVLLSTTADIGEQREAGGEAVISQQIVKTLTLKLTGDVFWSQLSDPDPGLAPYRSGLVEQGHATLNWDITQKDFLQFGAYLNGPSITAQGATSGYTYLDIGYRHKISDKLAVEVVATDPTGSYRTSTSLNAPGLSQITHVNFGFRAISVGFTYALGGAGKGGAKDFDFGGGGHAGH